jgi:hypothetical protein
VDETKGLAGDVGSGEENREWLEQRGERRAGGDGLEEAKARAERKPGPRIGRKEEKKRGGRGRLVEAKGQREASSEGSERGLDAETRSTRGSKQLGLAARDAQEGEE